MHSEMVTVSGALQTEIDDLNTSLVSVSSTLQSEIDALASSQSGALANTISSLSSTVDSALQSVNADLSSLSAAIDQEVSDRGTAIDSLSSDMVSRDAAALAEAKAYTDTAITNLVNGAPALLDTLSELASAIGDDENYFVHMAEKVTALSGAIDTAILDSANAVSAEASAREAAISSLSGSVDAHVSTLNSAITAEVAARESADSALDIRVTTLETGFDTLTGASGVTVLGTIASQNYDAVSITGGTVTSITLSGATLVDCTMDAGTF
jgi:hypothetical protein